MAYTDWAALANQAAEDDGKAGVLIDRLAEFLPDVKEIKGERYRWARTAIYQSIEAAIGYTEVLKGVINELKAKYAENAAEQQQREEAEATREANAQEIEGCSYGH